MAASLFSATHSFATSYSRSGLAHIRSALRSVSRRYGRTSALRVRALALFGRRATERAVRAALPASENLHKIRPTPQQTVPLFDHRVGAQQDRGRQFHTEGSGGFEIDD